MKMSRRTAWIIMFIFCGLIWGLLFVGFAYGEQPDKGSQPAQPDKGCEEIREKIKRMDLNDKQREFLESLIEEEQKK